MDSAASHIPLPSPAWSQLAASQGEMARPDAAPRTSAPSTAKQEAAALRARLLSMIADSERSRKAASAEAFNAR